MSPDSPPVHPPRERVITLWQGVAIIFGANIGAGILSLPYGARNGGFPALVIALAVAGFLTTASMLYVAEVALRTREPLQLSGLAERYLGRLGSWLVFAGVFINGTGALIAYANGSGRILGALFGGHPLVGTVVFYVVGTAVVWAGLKATGVSEQLVTLGMALVIAVLIGWTFLGPGIDPGHLVTMNPYFIVPIMNLTVFAFLAQYTVPELARGLAADRSDAVARSIVGGMTATGFLLALLPLAALGMMGPEHVTEVVTIGWGRQLGPVALWLANLFAVLAMMTSFWAIGLTAMHNVMDLCGWRHDAGAGRRALALAAVVLPPFLIAAFGLAGFVSALGYAGGFAGAIMSIVPVLMLRRARRHGDRSPAWTAGWVAHPVMQAVLVLVFGLAFLYSLLTLVGVLPDGWA